MSKREPHLTDGSVEAEWDMCWSCLVFPFPILSQVTLPETNITHENPSVPGKYHQNGGFSMAMLVYKSVYGI